MGSDPERSGFSGALRQIRRKSIISAHSRAISLCFCRAIRLWIVFGPAVAGGACRVGPGRVESPLGRIGTWPLRISASACSCGRRRCRSAPGSHHAELRPLADGRPHVRARRRDRGHAASTTTATSRRGSSSRTTRTSSVRFVDIHDDCEPRPGRPRAAAHRPYERGRVPARPRTRSARSPTRGASPSSRTRPARSPGPTPCTTRRTGRSTSRSSGVDVLALLAVQVLRPAPRARVRAARAARGLAAVQGAPAAERRRSGTASRRARCRTSSSPGSSRRSSTSTRSAGRRS